MEEFEELNSKVAGDSGTLAEELLYSTESVAFLLCELGFEGGREGEVVE